MSHEIVTRWPIVMPMIVSARDVGPNGRPSDATLGRWFERVRVAYLARCPRLREARRNGRIHLALALHLGPADPIQPGAPILVAGSVVELRPTSFDMAFRVRTLGPDGSVVTDARCTVRLEDAAGASLRLPEDVRDELIATERGAAEYC